MLTRFEGLNETTMTNVITELGATMTHATGKDAASVCTIMTQVDKILCLLSQHFRNVEELLEYMVASAGAEAVRLKSGADNGHSRAMGKADEYLIKELYENRLLTKSSMERTLHIAEEHMPCIDPSTMKTMLAAVPHTDEHDRANGEKAKADLSPGEICKVHTMLSQSGKAASDGGSQRSSGGKRQRNESSQERDKGGPRKRVPYSDLPDCWKC
eukprot:1837473-Rhodomonas_salina.1